MAEVLFPNSVPFGHGFGGDAYPPELREAGARADNRWLADFCRQAPGRRAGMAVVNTHPIRREVGLGLAADNESFGAIITSSLRARSARRRSARG